MADRLEQLIEMECADALLDSGVSVPLKRWKLPWLKRPLEVRVTMKRPRLRGQIHYRTNRRKSQRRHSEI